MPFLSDKSQTALARVIALANPDRPGAPSPEVCERLGRTLLAMFENMEHPARMFHLIAQVGTDQDPNVDLLLPLAWAISETGRPSMKTPRGEVS